MNNNCPKGGGIGEDIKEHFSIRRKEKMKIKQYVKVIAEQSSTID